MLSKQATATAAAILALVSGPALPQAAKLSDPQIAHIAYTADNIDIDTAKLALEKSKNKDIIAFANDMVRDHEAVNEQALALVKKLNVTPEDNDTSKGLLAQGEAQRAKLVKLNGADFDQAYAANDAAYHKTVNAALENTLIPGAKNSELKALLSTALKIFQGHQEHADHLPAMLK